MPKQNTSLADLFSTLAVRVPQAITLDVNAIRNSFGTDSTLITDLIVFFSQHRKRDLFNNIRFSLSDFAKTMNYNTDNLRRCEKEFKKKNLPVLKEHVYDGVFEYALFRMLKENVIFEGNYQGRYRAESFQLIQGIEIYNNTKANSKRIYEIKPSDFLLETIFREFFVLNIEDYVLAGSLNKNNRSTIGAARSLYMELIRGLHLARYQLQQGAEPIYFTNVDVLTRACYYDPTREPKDRKNALIKLLDKLQNLKHLKFTYEFFNAQGKRPAYDIKIEYSLDNMNEYEKELETKYFNYLFSILKKQFEQRFPQYVKTDNAFGTWLGNNQFDREIKINCVKSAYKHIYNEDLRESTAENFINSGLKAESWKLIQ